MRPGIELGVARTQAAIRELGLRPQAPLLAVVGTNGKGGCCRWLEALALAVGLRTGVFVSPWLAQPGEQIRLSGAPLSAAEFAAAKAGLPRLSEPVTEFEFHALLAMDRALAHDSEFIVLEAGMGGAGDAVNAWDADAAIVTSIGLDHQAWLGSTREAIARDKAGVARRGRPVWVAERDAPASLWERLREIGAEPRRLGVDFGFARTADGLDIWAKDRGETQVWTGLPWPVCRQDACLAVLAAAVAAFARLFPAISLTTRDVSVAIDAPALPGRLERIDAGIPVLLDVAHNAEAAAVLAGQLGDLPRPLRAVFGALRDKPVEAMYACLAPHVDHWYPAATRHPDRGMSREAMRARLGLAAYADAITAFRAALADAQGQGSILAFGGFEVVAGIWARNPANVAQAEA